MCPWLSLPGAVATTLHVVLGLRHQGLREAADKLSLKVLELIDGHYKTFGVLFEFYDSLNVTAPNRLRRKGQSNGGIRDFHWTAAITLLLLLRLDGSLPKQ